MSARPSRTRKLLLPALALLAALAWGVALPDRLQAQPPRVWLVNYVADIHGARADARVSYEPLREYTLMGGEIRSNGIYYTFTADLVGASGFGDMVNHTHNERFRVKIDLTREGLNLTTNPFGPGTPTTY